MIFYVLIITVIIFLLVAQMLHISLKQPNKSFSPKIVEVDSLGNTRKTAEINVESTKEEILEYGNNRMKELSIKLGERTYPITVTDIGLTVYLPFDYIQNHVFVQVHKKVYKVEAIIVKENTHIFRVLDNGKFIDLHKNQIHRFMDYTAYNFLMKKR